MKLIHLWFLLPMCLSLDCMTDCGDNEFCNTLAGVCSSCTLCVDVNSCPECSDGDDGGMTAQDYFAEMTRITNTMSQDCLEANAQILHCDEEEMEMNCPDAASFETYSADNSECLSADNMVETDHYLCKGGKDAYQTRCADLNGHLCYVSTTYGAGGPGGPMDTCPIDPVAGLTIDWYECYPDSCTDEDDEKIQQIQDLSLGLINKMLEDIGSGGCFVDEMTFVCPEVFDVGDGGAGDGGDDGGGADDGADAASGVARLGVYFLSFLLVGAYIC